MPPTGTFTLGRDHWATEQHICGACLGFTLRRDNLYADLLPSMVGPGRRPSRSGGLRPGVRGHRPPAMALAELLPYVSMRAGSAAS